MFKSNYIIKYNNSSLNTTYRFINDKTNTHYTTLYLDIEKYSNNTCPYIHSNFNLITNIFYV